MGIHQLPGLSNWQMCPNSVNFNLKLCFIINTEISLVDCLYLLLGVYLKWQAEAYIVRAVPFLHTTLRICIFYVIFQLRNAALYMALYGLTHQEVTPIPSIGKMRLGALLFLMCLKLVQLCQTSCRSAAHMILNYRSLKHKYLANLRAPTTGTMLGPEESFFPFCQVICPAVK